MFDLYVVAGNVLLFCLVFGMSATVDMKCIVTQLHNYKAIMTGIFVQFLVLPLLGFLVVKILKLPAAQGITLLVVTSSPGGSYSNWWCSLFNTDLALSVSMTAVSTILSLVMLPLNLLLYTKLSYQADVLQSLDWTALFTALLIVIAAIVAGITCSAKIHSRHFNRVANQVGNLAGLALIIFSATMTNSGDDSDTKIWSRDWSFYVATALPCLGGLLVATVVSTLVNLHKPERITVGIECCYQNIGIATSLALTMYEGDELSDAMGVPFFYGVVEAVLAGIYCFGAWKCNWTKAPSDAPIWQVLLTSYEVLEAEKKEISEIEVGISHSNTPSEKSVEQHEGNILTTYFNIAWLDPLFEHQQQPSQAQQTPKPYISPRLEPGEV